MKVIRTLSMVTLAVLGANLWAKPVVRIKFKNDTDYHVKTTVSHPIKGTSEPFTMKPHEENWASPLITYGNWIEWIRFEFNGKKASQLFKNPSKKLTGDFYYDADEGQAYYNVGGTWGDSKPGVYHITISQQKGGKLHLKVT